MRWRLAHFAVPLALAGPALADDPGTARELFDDARRSMNDGDYAAASTKLEQALRKQNGRGIKFQLAVCYEKLGRTASARTLYLQVASEARQADEPDREQVARAHAEQLAGRISHLRIVVAMPAEAMTVVRDDTAVAREDWGTPLAIDPGEHVVRAVAPGRIAWETRVTLVEGKDREIAIPALALESPPPAKIDVAHPTSPRPKPTSPWRTPALVLGGVGLATVAAGIAMTAVSAATYGASSRYCDASDHCADRGLSLRSDALTYGDIATGLVIGGVVTLVASGIVWLWNPGSSRAPAAAMAF